MLHQLRCSGLIDAVRVAREGYPSRLPHSSFVSRYRCLAPSPLAAGTPSAFGGASSSISFSDIAANPTTFGVGFGSSDKPIDVEPVVAPIVATPFAPPEHVPPVSTPKIKKEDPEFGKKKKIRGLQLKKIYCSTSETRVP